MAGGRPLKFKTVEELEQKINEYFLLCDPHVEEKDAIVWVSPKDGPKYQEVTRERYITEQKPYTVTGLAVYLDTSRETLINYEERNEFFDTIKKAKDKIHNFAEEQLFVGRNQAGTIFNLKNNWNWVDKTESDVTSGGKPIPIYGGQSTDISRHNSDQEDIPTQEEN